MRWRWTDVLWLTFGPSLLYLLLYLLSRSVVR